MALIEYNKDGWVCDRYPYDLKDQVGSIEVDEQTEAMTLSCELYHAWRVVDGELVQEQYEIKRWTEEERLQERTKLHTNTDNDYAKYARQVRLNVDMPHSQEVLDYIDRYNLEVSETVNKPNFPQEVTYPEYRLP